MQDNQFRLVTLGRLTLEGPAGDDESLTKRRLKLALLSFLAITKRPWPRDVLVDLFWGDRNEENARHSLSDALSHLRQSLGKDAITQRQADVGLSPDAPLTVDVLEIAEASARGDHEKVLELYGGEFLEGVHVADSPRFEDWRSKEHLKVQAFVEKARAAERAAPPVASARNITALPPALPSQKTRFAIWAAVLLALWFGGWAIATRRKPAPNGPPLIAITTVDNTAHDPSLAWLEEGLKQMIAASLARAPQVQIVPPAIVREAAQAGSPSDGALAVAKRAGAQIAVQGGVSHGPDAYRLDMTIRDVASGKQVASFTVTALDPIAMADAASARILASVASTSGPHLAEVETRNARAYQLYVQSQIAWNEGRSDETVRDLDAALTEDSLFVSAILARLDLALQRAGEFPIAGKLGRRFQRIQDRASDWDRLRIATYVALRSGEHARAEALARDALTRYPSDPRAYLQLANVYWTHGRMAQAESVMTTLVALDSTGRAAPFGPCVPCAAYSWLSGFHGEQGDAARAERDARRLVALQPQGPIGYGVLADALAYAGRFTESLEAMRRSQTVNGSTRHDQLGTIQMLARNHAAADSAFRDWSRTSDANRRRDLADRWFTLERERGRFRSEILARPSAGEILPEVVHADNLARVGDIVGARAVFERNGHYSGREEELGPFMRQAGDLARGFTWPHALMADALARNGADTIVLKALADSVEREGARSYYGRDWRVHHHIRGIIAMRAGRFAEAEAQFQSARWGAAGWTRTVQLLAAAQAAQKRAVDAIATLRDAYKGPLDAMGRYVPRSELDFDMARYFASAGMTDSARVYAGYVRAAWAAADPEVRKRLAELPNY